MVYWDKILDEDIVRQRMTWVYQLQDVDLDAMSKCTATIKVVDYTTDGKSRWTPEQITRLRGSSKTILSYVSIGEAEDYRSYWKADWKIHKPDWLSLENPAWVGNYKVRYWDRNWQKIIVPEIVENARRGFDGVYLDIIDAYEYWEDRKIDDADQRMIDFVEHIAKEARKVNPDFWIIPQNGAGLLDIPRYADLVSGIGREDVFYGEDTDGKRNSDTSIVHNMAQLNVLRKRNKPVLCVEYVSGDQTQRELGTAFRAAGYIPYFTKRDLDVLTPPFK